MFDLLDAIGCDYRRLPPWVIRASYHLCRRVTGSPESICSWAYATKRRRLVKLLGENHCRTCNQFWRG